MRHLAALLLAVALLTACRDGWLDHRLRCGQIDYCVPWTASGGVL